MTSSLERESAPAPSSLAEMDGHESHELSSGWQAARAPADLNVDVAGIDALDWMFARVPGTAAGALRDAGEWRAGEGYDFDAEDWWFRTSFDARPVAAGEAVRLCLDGIATVAEVYLNGELVLESDSMFAAHSLDVAGRLRASNELAIRCRALGPLLSEPRRPRARWRTRLVAGNLRFYRTMLLGRCPGIAAEPAAVGPWRAVRLERSRRVEARELRLRPLVDGAAGVLSVTVRVRAVGENAVSGVEVRLSGPSGERSAPLTLDAIADPSDGWVVARGELRIADVARWWPHTHGEPALHDVAVHVSDAHGLATVAAARVGFRELAAGAAADHDIERDGLDLHVNGVRVFVRGAVWTGVDSIGLAPSASELREALVRVREAGMNMVRLPGTGVYETREFHDLCDELGILVWQDMMFANLDYPIADERFRATVVSEARDVLGALAARASVVVVCGNSEVEQQAAMMGRDVSLARGELFGELLPALLRDSGADAVYVPSAPCGGDLPFRPGCGIGTYYAVGCYRRPLEDVRRAGVRFAAECLAFSHVPAAAVVAELLARESAQLAGEDALWKAGVPRENGADWDFEDIRDHYLQLLFNVDGAELRRTDLPRYLELSRMLTGEIVAEVFGEWRRADSPCGGGLMLWLRDLLPGAGWGVLDHRGVPKIVYHHLKRALAPVAVWTVDENLGGVVAHVANDGPTPLRASLRVALYRDGEQPVGAASVAIALEGHSQGQWNVESVIGHFVDAAWAYRFGPPAQDAIVVTLERDGERMLSQAMRFPAGRPLRRESPKELGFGAAGEALPDGGVRLTVWSERLAYGVRIDAPGFEASDDGFSIEPGHRRLLALRPSRANGATGTISVGAVNMSAPVRIALA